MGQMTRILLEDQQKTLPTFEEPRRVEVDAMELHELVASEEGRTSPEMEETRKNLRQLRRCPFREKCMASWKIRK